MRIIPAGREITDPRLRIALHRLWPSTCTIQLILTTTSTANQAVPSGASTVSGMDEIPCRIAPIVRERPTDDLAVRTVVDEYHVRRHVLLNGYFPTIKVDEMQAVIDGVTYPIRGVDFDGNRFTTRLKVEIVRPNGQ